MEQAYEAALSIAHVAAGWADAAAGFGVNAWDVAAATLILKNSGGRYEPLTLGKVGVRAYSPSSDPVFIDCDAITLDFSHAALGGRDSLEFAMAMGDRMRHVHLTDGTVSMRDGQLLDEHLVPGRGTQPVAEVVRYLASTGWSGSLVAEVNTAGAGSEDGRLAMLRETREFAASQIAAGRRGRRSGVS